MQQWLFHFPTWPVVPAHGQASWDIEVQWGQSANPRLKDAWVNRVDTLHAKHIAPNFLRLLQTICLGKDTFISSLLNLVGQLYDNET